MLTRFEAYIQEKDLCDTQDEILLAVSGGMDSVVMTDLFINAGYSCILLHCNFKLRDSESDRDEAFVRSLAAKYEIPIYVKHFETKEFANENGLSIQMAARELRYKWFDEMAEKTHSEHIATAHNVNDSVETLLLNLSRGTGLKGLNGIPCKNGNYIRPLLFAKRSEISEYCIFNNLEFREDSSNASKKYSRNKIRHDLIPLFEEINPSFLDTMNENIQRFGEAYELYRKEVLRVKEEIFIDKESHKEIDLLSLRKLIPLSTWLYELFSEYAFTIDQCLNIEKIIDSDSGKQFISPSYRLFKDREKLLLFETEDKNFDRYYIDSPENKATLPFSMDMEIIKRDQLNEYPDSSKIAVLDLDKLSFPLTVRKWHHGDYFFPLGMDQIKKLSDFFIDNKIPVPVKNRTWILCSGKDIVWIIGQRIDNRFKITDKTSSILKFHLY